MTPPPPFQGVVLGTRCHAWVLSSPPRVCSKEGGEAVPRTPWPGYGIQPVSGPLTPCTVCSCREAPHRQPMHRQRRFVYQNIRINRGLFSYCFVNFYASVPILTVLTAGGWFATLTVPASLTVYNGNFNAIRHEGSKVARNCMDASAIFIINTRNLNPNFSGCRNRIFDFDIPALDLTSSSGPTGFRMHESTSLLSCPPFVLKIWAKQS